MNKSKDKSLEESNLRRRRELEENKKLQRQLKHASEVDVIGLKKLYKLSIRVYILLLSIVVATIFLDRSTGLQLLYAIGQIVVGAIQVIGLL